MIKTGWCSYQYSNRKVIGQDCIEAHIENNALTIHYESGNKETVDLNDVIKVTFRVKEVHT